MSNTVTLIDLYSDKKGEINAFLNKFYDNSIYSYDMLKWEKAYENPIEMSELIGAYADNLDEYKINMWISLDPRCIH